MKVGVGSYAFRWSIGFKDRVPERPMSAVQLVDQAADLGAEVLQIADNLPLHRLAAGELDRIAERAGERGIALEVGTDGASDENIERYLSIARRLSAGVLRLTLDRRDLSEPRDALAGRLRRAGERFDAAGCAIAIENHFLMPTDELVELFESVDHTAVGACVDVANSIATQEWPLETVGKLAPYARSLHLKDCRIEIDAYGVGMHVTGVPLGQGIVNLEAVVAAVRGADHDVNAVIEHWLPFEAAGGSVSITDLEAEWTRKGLERALQLAQALD